MHALHASGSTDATAVGLRVHNASAKPTPYLSNLHASMQWENVSAHVHLRPSETRGCIHLFSTCVSLSSSDTSVAHDGTRAQQFPWQHIINNILSLTKLVGNKTCPVYL